MLKFRFPSMLARLLLAITCVITCASCSTAAQEREAALFRRIGPLKNWTLVRTESYRNEGGRLTRALYRPTKSILDGTRSLCAEVSEGRFGNVMIASGTIRVDKCLQPGGIPVPSIDHCLVSVIVGYPNFDPNALDERGLIVDVNC
jgi:hypothetical protein